MTAAADAVTPPSASPSVPDGAGQKQHNLLLGVFYSFVNILALTQTYVIIKFLRYMNPAQICSLFNTLTVFFCLPISVYCVRGSWFPEGDRRLLLLRGLFVGTGMYLNTMAFRYLPLMEATVIGAMRPACMVIAARFYLKEPCGLVQILALFLSVCGVLLSIRLPELLDQRNSDPTELHLYLLGLACAIGFVIFTSGGVVVLGKMRHLHYSLPIVFSSTGATVEAALINYFVAPFEVPRCGLDQALVVLVGFSYFVASITFVMAIQVESFATITIIRNAFELVLSAVWQITIFGDKPSVYTFCGAALVMASTFAIGARQIVASFPEGSDKRNRFRCLLL